MATASRDFTATSSQYINTDTTLANFEYTQAFSVTAWVYLKSNVSGAIVARENNAGTRGWMLYHKAGASTPKFSIELVSSGAAWVGVTTTAQFTLNAWHHVALSYTGSGTAAGMTLYVDGSAQATAIDSNTLASSTIIQATETQIGARGGSAAPALYANARIARVTIHNVALTGAEVTTLFGGASMVYRGLQAWHELTTTGLTLTADWSGNGHVGFVQAATPMAAGPAYTALGPNLGTSGGATLSGPITRNPSNPVLTNPGYPSGATGQIDDTQAGPPVVLKMGPTDYRMWYEASHYGATLDPPNQTGLYDNDTVTAYATSTNGTVWTRKQTGGITNTIFNVNTLTTNPPGNNTAMKAWMKGESSPGTVFYDASAGIWKCWGHGGNNTGPRRIYYATSSSTDGLSNWVVQNNGLAVIQEGTGSQWDSDTHGIADSRVIKMSATSYVMLYVGSDSTGAIGQIGLATSTNGLVWTKSASNPVLTVGPAGSWDASVLFAGGFVYDVPLGLYLLWYGAQKPVLGVPDGMGFAWSTNAVTWTKGAFNPVLAGLDTAGLEAGGMGSTVWTYLDGTTYRTLWRADNGVGGATAFRGRNEGTNPQIVTSGAPGPLTNPGNLTYTGNVGGPGALTNPSSLFYTATTGVAPANPIPTALIEIAFSTNPTVTPVWTDVTPYVQSFSINRGRQRELNSIQTGTAQVLLDNRDRRFDPSNTASPYYPNVLPMRRVRISAIWQGVTSPQFTGYIESLPQTWQGWGDATVPLSAADGFKVLNFAQLNTSFPQERSDIRIGEVLTAIGWTVGGVQWILGDAALGVLGSTTLLGPTGDRNLGVGSSDIQPSTLSNTSALAHMQDVATTEMGMLFMDKAGRVTFIGHPYIPNVSLATFGELELLYTGLTFQYDDNTIYNSVRITRVGGTEQVASDATSQAQFYLRTLVFSNTLHMSDSRAAMTAGYLNSRYKQPFLEAVGMLLDGTADPVNQWPQILQREIGDVVTVRRRPPGGGAVIEQISTIQGMSMTYSASANDWAASWWLNAADQTRYWQLGDATQGLLGITTRLFF